MKWNNDAYTKKAQKENWLARSVYKLEEIDRRERILARAKLIVDLGASPGSWSQYCLQKLPQAEIVAVDLSPMRVSDPRLRFFETSIEKMDWPGVLADRLADVVMSDMAPKTSGIHARDTALSFELSSLALETATKILNFRGSFLCKVFMGEDFEQFHQNVKATFSHVRLLRPDSTRKHSREIYVIGKELRTRSAVAPVDR